MANTILTSTRILRECLASFRANLGLADAVDRQYDAEFAKEGKKDGSTIYVRQPNRSTVGTGRAINVTDTLETYSAITCATQKHVALTFNSADLTMKVQDFRKRFIEQPMAQLAATVDAAGFTALNTKVSNLVGTAGTTPSAIATYLSAQQKLNEYMAPLTNRAVVFNPAAQAASAAVHIALFNPGNKVSDIYSKGYQTTGLGANWYMDQQVASITCGSRVGTIVVDDAAATYGVAGNTTVHIDGLTNATDTIAAGEVFTINECYAVNPLTGDSLSNLKQWCVTTAATAASNEVDLTVSEAMYTSGPLKNCSTYAVNDKGITFVGTASTAYPHNYMVQKDAVALVTSPLEIHEGAHWCEQASFDGITMRLWRDGDIRNDESITRIDVLYGWAVLRPEHCCRIIG